MNFGTGFYFASLDHVILLVGQSNRNKDLNLLAWKKFFNSSLMNLPTYQNCTIRIRQPFTKIWISIMQIVLNLDNVIFATLQSSLWLHAFFHSSPSCAISNLSIPMPYESIIPLYKIVILEHFPSDLHMLSMLPAFILSQDGEGREKPLYFQFCRLTHTAGGAWSLLAEQIVIFLIYNLLCQPVLTCQALKHLYLPL